MKNTLLIAVGIMAGISLVAGGAFAGTVNITIPDESYSSPSGWYGGPNQEDQEVEPHNLTGQQWDLEGVFFDDISSDLSMVGGFDFVNGIPSRHVSSGDLFIDITGDAQYGSGLPPGNGIVPANYNPYQVVPDTFGYDFVVDLDFSTLTYAVYDIRANGALIQTDSQQQNDAANPWRLYSGGELIATGSIGYVTGLSNGDTGFLGGLHNAATVNLAWLAPYYDPYIGFTTHFTEECGNDNLMGHFSDVPEPATLSLLGLGLLGAVMRKKFWA